MLRRFFFNPILEAINDPLKIFKLFIKYLGAIFGFILATAGLIQFFTKKDLSMYGILGLVYVVVFLITITSLLFFNAYVASEKINLKRWLRVATNIVVIVVLGLAGIGIYYLSRSTTIFIISEGYVYSAEILNREYKKVYYGMPDCLDSDCLQKFEGELPDDRFAVLPRATFQISQRIRYGDYFIRLTFGRNTYKDTLDQMLHLSSRTDTIRVFSRHLYRN